MALTVVAALGAPNSNAYQTTRAVQALLEAVPNAGAFTGDTVDAAAKDVANVHATTMLDVILWRGIRLKTRAEQALSWPRVFVEDPDGGATADVYRGVGYNGLIIYLPETEVPRRILRAHAMLALEIMRAGTSDIWGVDDSLNVDSDKLDVLETKFIDVDKRRKGLRIYPQIWREIFPLMKLSEGLSTERA